MRERRLLLGTVLAVSLVLAAGTPLAWALTRPPGDEGVLPAAQAAAPSPGSAASAGEPGAAQAAAPSPGSAASAGEPGASARASRPARDPASRGPATPPATARSARVGDLQQPTSAPPARLAIPALGVDAPVAAVGVAGDGTMAVPDDVDEAGWYQHGPAPGEPGAAVLAGHVDSREQGPGAFYDLRKLRPGTEIVVTDADGRTQRFEVAARRTYDKAELPTDELFSRAGPPELVLVTCGGDFDRGTGSYRANVVVHAVPAGDAPER